MSLGNETEIGGVEKFPAVCSICKKETTVPFKPEAGRSVYCKDCIAKLKSGELKPIKGSINQIKYDESKFFKPLSDLGIEFEQKGNVSSGNFEEKRTVVSHSHDKQEVKTTPGIFSAIKKVFNKNPAYTKPAQSVNRQNITPIKNKFTNEKPKIARMGKENLALKEILNKTLSENKIFEAKKAEPKVEELKKSEVEAISLNQLKVSTSPLSQQKDRSASVDDMNKLKNLINKSESIKEEEEIKKEEIFIDKEADASVEKVGEELAELITEVILKKKKEAEPITEPIIQKMATEESIVKTKEADSVTTQNASNQPINKKIPSMNVVREVPEDILRKILE
jgi:CxxC-x17-CxxC domain-containing protein